MDTYLDRDTATQYASWFKALSDPTRIQIVTLLARNGASMTVGQIVEAVHVVQSTVSAHLKILSEVGFVLVEQHGRARYYQVNQACVGCFHRRRRRHGAARTRAGPDLRGG